jgi:hypothetical protein
VRLVSQRLAGRRVRSLCWALLRFRWGGRSRIAMLVCITRSPTSAIYFLVREQQPAVRPIATGMWANPVADTITGTSRR